MIYLTEAPPFIAVQALRSLKQPEVTMLVRQFIHLTTEAIVVAIALILGLPFFLTLAMPFIGG